MKIRRIRRMKQQKASNKESAQQSRSITIMNTRKEEASYYCSSKWSEEIGDDVFGLILQRLCLTDYLRTQAVCSTWRSFVPRSIASNKSCPPLLPQLPLIFLETQPSNYLSFFNLSTKRAFDFTNASSDFDCYGSIQGWLIMTDRTGTGFRTVFFFNPLTKATVLMPSRLNCGLFRIKKLVASTKPSDPNCVVVCVFFTNELAISGVADESWTVIHEEKGICFIDVEILNGKLYGLVYKMFHNMLDFITVCDLQNKPLKLKLLAVNHPSLSAHFSRFLAIDDDASSGDLLLIEMPYETILWENNKEKMKSNAKKKKKINDKEEKIYVPEFIGSSVYKLSSSQDEWIEVKNMRNRMLFVSKRKSLVVSNIGELHGPQDLSKDNCIYFTCHDPKYGGINRRKGIRIGRYCPSDKKTNHYTCERLISDNLLSSVWFIPSFS